MTYEVRNNLASLNPYNPHELEQQHGIVLRVVKPDLIQISNLVRRYKEGIMYCRRYGNNIYASHISLDICINKN
jgi:hypothetical protein